MSDNYLSVHDLPFISQKSLENSVKIGKMYKDIFFDDNFLTKYCSKSCTWKDDKLCLLK